MGNENLKIDGFAQSIYEISATPKETVGTLRILADGRKFRYAQAGAAALEAGKITEAPVLDADFCNKACPTAAIGDTEITVTHVATGAAYPADYFRGGYLMITDGLVQYPIVSSSAVTTSSTTIDLHLGQALMIALTSGKEFNLVASPWKYVITMANVPCMPTGVPQVEVTALYYCWLQTGGIGHCLVDATPTVGSMLVPDADDGALSVIATTASTGTWDTDAPYIAIAMGLAYDSAAATVHLLID